MTAALILAGVVLLVLAVVACRDHAKRKADEARAEGVAEGTREALRRAIERARKRDGGDG